ALPDFRAEERTFQLITQLAGRSGRDAPGRVLVQTFQPDARPIAHAARHDVGRFLGEELERRAALGYPPVNHLVRIAVSGPDPAGWWPRRRPGGAWSAPGRGSPRAGRPPTCRAPPRCCVSEIAIAAS